MSDLPTPTLQASYEACRQITAARARSFYLGLRLAPEPERSALYALYAWNRLGDDIVDETDEPVESRRCRLDGFAEATRAACQGRTEARGDLWLALGDVLQRFPIEPAWLESMLRGLGRDLQHTQPETPEQLDRYCDEVAGSVGRCCVAVWGVRPDAELAEAFHLADCLGRAFQLTNILRDIGEDAQLRPPRVYVPQASFDRHGLGIDDLLSWRQPSACQALVLELAAEARRSFAAGETLLDRLRPRFRPTLWAMHRIYERTLGLIEQEPRRSVRASHVRPSRAVAMSIACRAFAMSALASGRD